MPRALPLFAALSAALLLQAGAAARPAAAGDGAAEVAAPAVRPLLTVHKHPSCGCCGVWIEHMRQAGFRVEARDTAQMSPVKAAAGVPEALASCHTADVDGYFIEGHVPAADVARLLRERPAARGLAVPGMPLGSPGMEHPDGLQQPYTVQLVLDDGSTRPFNRYPQD